MYKIYKKGSLKNNDSSSLEIKSGSWCETFKLGDILRLNEFKKFGGGREGTLNRIPWINKKLKG